MKLTSSWLNRTAKNLPKNVFLLFVKIFLAPSFLPQIDFIKWLYSLLQSIKKYPMLFKKIYILLWIWWWRLLLSLHSWNDIRRWIMYLYILLLIILTDTNYHSQVRPYFRESIRRCFTCILWNNKILKWKKESHFYFLHLFTRKNSPLENVI